MKFLISIFFITSTYLSFGQMVNIESKRMQTDSVRYAGRNDINFAYNDNNGSYVFTSSLSSANQFKTKNLRNIFLVIGDYNSILTKERDYQNSWLFHSRFNHKFNSVIRSEIFAQYGGNKVLDVNERIVAGVGARFKLVSADFLNLYLGESVMWDREANYESDTSFYNWRNNFYISSSLNLLKDKLELINTVYWQVNYNETTDFNILEQLKLDFTLSKKISTFILLDYFYDSNTPLNRKQYYFRTKFGIGLKL